MLLEEAAPFGAKGDLLGRLVLRLVVTPYVVKGGLLSQLVPLAVAILWLVKGGLLGHLAVAEVSSTRTPASPGIGLHLGARAPST